MKTLLRIDSSSRIVASHSRQLADRVETAWRNAHPGGEVVFRDLVTTHVPHISEDTVEGFHTPGHKMDNRLKDATALSDLLISELQAADEILISSPLYNLSTPSRLKAWIDQVVRSGKTFAVDETGDYRGLLAGKVAYLVLARGSKYSGTEMEKFDFQIPYLQAILGFMGIRVNEIFLLDGSSYPELLQTNLHALKNQIKDTFTTANTLS